MRASRKARQQLAQNRGADQQVGATLNDSHDFVIAPLEGNVGIRIQDDTSHGFTLLPQRRFNLSKVTCNRLKITSVLRAPGPLQSVKVVKTLRTLVS